MSKTVKIGMIGCGYVALQDYFPVLAREDIKDKAEVTAVCDNVPGRADEICRRFGFRQAFADYDELLEKADVDAVAILTPIPLHFNQAKKALEAGKHVYVQKTMTTTLAEALELSRLAKERGLTLCASPGQMIDAQHRKAKELLDAGKIGKVCFVRGQGPHPGHENQELFGIDPSWYYKKGGGPLMDVAVYPLTSITGLLGPAKRVTAFSGIAVPDRYWGERKLEVSEDDNAVMLLDFGEGVFASIQGNFVTRKVNTPQVELYGTKGVIQIGGWTRPDVPLEVYTEDDVLGSQAGWYRPVAPVNAKPTAPIKPTAGDLLHMVDSLLAGTEPLLGGDHAAHVIEIIEKACESARTGRAMTLSSVF